jgi:hypothetical protein
MNQTPNVTRQQRKKSKQTQQLKQWEQGTVAIQRQSQSRELRLVELISERSDAQGAPNCFTATSCPNLSCIGTCDAFGRCDDPTCPNAHRYQDVQEVPALPNSTMYQFHEHSRYVIPGPPIPHAVMTCQMQQGPNIAGPPARAQMQQDTSNAGRSVSFSQGLQSCLHDEVQEAVMHVNGKSRDASTQHTKNSSHKGRSSPGISNAMLLTLLDVATDPAIVTEFLSTHPNVDPAPQ